MKSPKKDMIRQNAMNDIFILKNWIKNGYIDTMIAGAGGAYRMVLKDATLTLKRLDDGTLSGSLKSRSQRVISVLKSMLTDTGIEFS